MAKDRERVEKGAPEGSGAAAEPAVRDAPIEKRADDRLGRAQFADAIAQHIVDGNLSDGAVVAVMGPWGSGKTSVLNMVREALGERPDDVEIFDFNPWYFSGTQQLVEHFFADTAARFTESGDETSRRRPACSSGMRASCDQRPTYRRSSQLWAFPE